MQVGAALAVYAAACVPGCAKTMELPDEATELLGTVHQHAGLLLQTASHLQVFTFTPSRWCCRHAAALHNAATCHVAVIRCIAGFIEGIYPFMSLGLQL